MNVVKQKGEIARWEHKTWGDGGGGSKEPTNHPQELAPAGAADQETRPSLASFACSSA